MTRARGMLVAVGVLLATTACVAMPDEGPVVEDVVADEVQDAGGAFYEPRPPAAGAGPREVAVGFLEAMRATPIKTAVAAEYLTDAARERWAPERATLTYDDLGQPTGTSTVHVRLVGAEKYDERGAWTRGAGRASSALHLPMVREDGEWRIASVPDALVVPVSLFEDWFDRAELYFFTPDREVLVPEPVYVPTGDQFAASLVRGLLAGPGEGLEGVEQSALPAGLQLALNSVPIDERGVAEVVLEGPDVPQDDDLDEAMAAQLAWTLRQESRVRSIRLTVNGRHVRPTGERATIDVRSGRLYSPVGATASPELFALDDGRLLRGSASDLKATTGPFGAEGSDLKSVAVDVSGTWAVGVTSSGTRLLQAPVQGSGQSTVLLDDGRNLLPPARDAQGRVWVVDRRRGGARVTVLTDERRQQVTVPGVTGKDVTRLLVSRDATRLVAVVHGPRRDRVVVSRLAHDVGRDRFSARPADEVAVLSPDADVRFSDVSWWSVDQVAVLSDVSKDLAQVKVVGVDGAPDEQLTSGPWRVRGQPDRLVSSPVEGTDPYVRIDDVLRPLADPTRRAWTIDGALTWLGYAG